MQLNFTIPDNLDSDSIEKINDKVNRMVRDASYKLYISNNPGVQDITVQNLQGLDQVQITFSDKVLGQTVAKKIIKNGLFTNPASINKNDSVLVVVTDGITSLVDLQSVL